MGTEALPSLIVASLDLQLVRLLRDAMGTGGNSRPVSGLGPAPTVIERRFQIEPEPKILPRKRIETEPRIEPRKVIRPADRFEPRECDLMPVPVPVECYKPCRKPPVEPPWRVLPWEQPLDCRIEPKIKVLIKPPDIIHKGSLIDFFI